MNGLIIDIIHSWHEIGKNYFSLDTLLCLSDFASPLLFHPDLKILHRRKNQVFIWAWVVKQREDSKKLKSQVSFYLGFVNVQSATGAS